MICPLLDDTVLLWKTCTLCTTHGIKLVNYSLFAFNSNWSLLHMQPEDLKSYAVGRIRTLQTVDGCAVTPEEVSIATKKVMASHLTMAMVWSHAHADVAPLPSLSVAPIAQTFCEHQHGLQITNPSPSPTEWCVKVSRCYDLSHQSVC